MTTDLDDRWANAIHAAGHLHPAPDVDAAWAAVAQRAAGPPTLPDHDGTWVKRRRMRLAIAALVLAIATIGGIALTRTHEPDRLVTGGSDTTDAAPTRLVEVPGIGLTNASWAPQIRSLLAAAATDGVVLTGNSYRDPARQVALRRANCGSSHYAIYDMAPSRCRPPTARPTLTDHGRGLAIDFASCASTRTPCYQWLRAHASTYDLVNNSPNPWHWSIRHR